MKAKTGHSIILSIKQLETIIEKMRANQISEPAMSNEVKFRLSFDTDWDALVIDPEANGYQFSGYAECNGMGV